MGNDKMKETHGLLYPISPMTNLTFNFVYSFIYSPLASNATLFCT